MKKDRYVAIDFETMTTWRASVCSVGLAVIENGKIVDTFYSLVCPLSKDENYYCCLTHGLKYKDVKDSPKFDEIWEKIDKEYIKGSPLIAHNAPFEKSCINACNETFDTNNDYEYIDTLKLSRKYLSKLEKHTLDVVCEALHCKLKHHHNALDDAKACAEIFIKLGKKHKEILNG